MDSFLTLPTHVLHPVLSCRPGPSGFTPATLRCHFFPAEPLFAFSLRWLVVLGCPLPAQAPAHWSIGALFNQFLDGRSFSPGATLRRKGEKLPGGKAPPQCSRNDQVLGNTAKGSSAKARPFFKMGTCMEHVAQLHTRPTPGTPYTCVKIQPSARAAHVARPIRIWFCAPRHFAWVERVEEENTWSRMRFEARTTLRARIARVS